ncbi:hypothetical protein SN13T_3011 [Lactiplantibacillus plantarum]|nr:hypothetical protein SN13T_3011 [Lactiplantibacillus plantarum]
MSRNTGVSHASHPIGTTPCRTSDLTHYLVADNPDQEAKNKLTIDEAKVCEAPEIAVNLSYTSFKAYIVNH